MKMRCSIFLFLCWMLPTIICAEDYGGLKSALSQTLNARLEQYEGVSSEDSLDIAKGRSQIKKEIISIIRSLSGKEASPVVDSILKEYHVDKVPQTVAIEVLSVIYTPNLANPQYTLNANIEIALARLGHEEAFRNIVEGLNSENSTIKFQTFSKLARIRTEASLSILGEFLLGDHEDGFPAMPSLGHGFSPSSEVLAMMALSSEFSEIGPNPREKREQHILISWQEWWRDGFWKNKLDSEDTTSEVPQETLPNLTTQNIVSEGSKIFTESSEETGEESSRWWLWLIGALVVVGGVLVLRPKK